MPEKPEFYYRQSAVIPLRRRAGELEILMITSRKKKRWVLPKGVIEPDLTPPESAAKEALEEAGIEGRVAADPAGTYHYRKWGGTCSVLVYVMEVELVHAAWEEDFRDREWVRPEEAMARVDEDELRQILHAASDCH